MPHPQLTDLEPYLLDGRRRKRRDAGFEPGSDTTTFTVPADIELAVSIDTLVAGVHFPSDTAPTNLGHKALAVNLSDMAAMGAEPALALVSLTVPTPDKGWLCGFGEGLNLLADRHGVQLVAFHTGQGPMAITIQVYGWVPTGAAIRRGTARPGDLIYVTGTVGDAGLALSARNGDIEIAVRDLEYLEQRLARPLPRVATGMGLRSVASAAIDVSDGLAADLGHILAASKLGASLQMQRLPLSSTLLNNVVQERAWDLALSSGDDYELCFTVPPTRVNMLGDRSRDFDCGVTCIGIIQEERGLRCLRDDGSLFLPSAGYRHFV